MMSIVLDMFKVDCVAEADQLLPPGVNRIKDLTQLVLSEGVSAVIKINS
jgi:hypothetical protein